MGILGLYAMFTLGGNHHPTSSDPPSEACEERAGEPTDMCGEPTDMCETRKKKPGDRAKKFQQVGNFESTKSATVKCVNMRNPLYYGIGDRQRPAEPCGITFHCIIVESL